MLSSNNGKSHKTLCISSRSSSPALMFKLIDPTDPEWNTTLVPKFLLLFKSSIFSFVHFFRLSCVWCVHNCSICMCGVHMQCCTFMWRPKVNVRNHPWWLFHLSLNETQNLLIQLASLSSFLWGSPVSIFQGWNYNGLSYPPGIYVCSGNPNSCPYACKHLNYWTISVASYILYSYVNSITIY